MFAHRNFWIFLYGLQFLIGRYHVATKAIGYSSRPFGNPNYVASHNGISAGRTMKKPRGYYSPPVRVTTSVQDFCRDHPPGSYGNPIYHCVVYHVCQGDGRYDTMPCPGQLKFNDAQGICDWPYNVDDRCNAVKGKQPRLTSQASSNNPVDNIKLDIRVFGHPVDDGGPARTEPENRILQPETHGPFYLRYDPLQNSQDGPFPAEHRAQHLQIEYPTYLTFRKPTRRPKVFSLF